MSQVAMHSSNPALARFEKPQTWDQLDARERKLGVMTLSGAINASAMLLGICVAGAFATWAFLPEQYVLMATIGAAIVGFLIALPISFKPSLAPYLGFPAAAVEGVFVGGASLLYASWMGAMNTTDTSGATMRMLANAGSAIVIQAVLLTFGVFAAMLIAYSTRVIRATPALMKGIMAATFGVVFMWVGYLLLGLFTPMPSLFQMGWLGVGVCAVIVGIAAFNLIIDFHVIEEGAKREMPKHMEWFAAWGLMITLVWLYVSILRLLAMIAAARD